MLQENELMDLESSVHNSNLCETLENAGPILDDFSISYNNDFEIQYPMNSTCFIEPTESLSVNQKELSSKNISSQDDKKINFDNCKSNSK